MKRILILLLVCIAFNSCTQVYYDGNGKEFKVLNQAKDRSFVNPEQLQQNAFNLNAFLHPDCDTCSTVQYVLPSDIKQIAEKTNKLFVVFYNPNCPSAKDFIQLAKAVEDKHIPVLLVSIFNSPDVMRKWYNKEGLENKICYILPNTIAYGEGVLAKQIPFLKALCKNCYSEIGDELLYTSFIILKDKGNVILLNNMGYKIYYPEGALPWVEKNI